MLEALRQEVAAQLQLTARARKDALKWINTVRKSIRCDHRKNAGKTRELLTHGVDI